MFSCSLVRCSSAVEKTRNNTELGRNSNDNDTTHINTSHCARTHAHLELHNHSHEYSGVMFSRACTTIPSSQT